MVEVDQIVLHHVKVRRQINPVGLARLHEMDGYRADTYGASFADVYDEWYGDLDDLGDLIAMLAEFADTGPVCELGVGTGRIAIPLAATGLSVVGIDSSTAMLERLAGADPSASVEVVQGDMVDDIPAGPFSLIVIAFNTLFNLNDADQQAACVKNAAARLRPGGRLFIDGIVPESTIASYGLTIDDVTVRDLSVDRVILSVSRHRPAEQTAEGQFIEFTESGGIRLRPWSVRYSTPEQIDAMAGAAGLQLEHRWCDLQRGAFTDEARRHVSVYRKPDTSS
jgi:SAM-dependent methyltransferase